MTGQFHTNENSVLISQTEIFIFMIIFQMAFSDVDINNVFYKKINIFDEFLHFFFISLSIYIFQYLFIHLFNRRIGFH